MYHQTVYAKGAKPVIVKSSTTTDYRIPAAGRWKKIVPYVMHEQAMPEKKNWQKVLPLDARGRDMCHLD